MNTQFSEIQVHCQRLNRRHRFIASGLGLIAWSSLWALIGLWDFFVSPIREQSATILLVGSITLVISLSVWIYRKNRERFHLDSKSLARRIETSNTHLNDLLVTAADLEARAKSVANPLEQHVIDSAKDRLGEFDWRAGSTHWLERTLTLGAAILLAALMTWAALHTAALKKAGHYIADWIDGAPTGLIIDGYPSEVPVGTDTSVSISVNRWENAAFIDWRDAQGLQRERVVINSSGEGEFTFYSIASPTEFQVTTPSLRSKWHRIDAYEPARVDSIEIEITPPAYTRSAPIVHDQLLDLQVLEGSRVAMTLQSKAAAEIALRFAEAQAALSSSEGGFFQSTFTPEQSGPFGFILRDAKGREERTPTHQIEIIPDLPPSVEILEPGQDQTLTPDQQFLLQVFSADDYGLSQARVHLKLSNSEETVLELPLSPSEGTEPSDQDTPLKESEIQAGISLKTLGATDGEFLALHVEVSDNREPEANRTRSDLVFIEIRTPIPPVEMEGMPSEQQQINLRELIDEQKRILRETYRLENSVADDRINPLPELISALSALGVEINRVFNDIRQELSDAGLTELIDLFVEAGEANQAAIQELEATRPQESFEPQSTTLSNLLKLENAFRQNIISKNPSEGQGESSSESQSESGEDSEGAGENIDQLLEAKESLESMIGEQNRLNAAYDRAARSEWRQDAAEADAADQRALAGESASLSEQLAGVGESGRLRSMLSDARGHMGSAASEAAKADGAGSLRSGLRARESLRRAAAELDTMIADASGQQLAAAAQAAAQLARAQAEASAASQSAATGGASGDQLASMEADQRALREHYEDFLQALEAQARAAASFSPDASRSLMEAAGRARSQSTGSDMERAANALLYGQPGMASPMQSSAARQLADLSASLSEAREQMGNNPMARARALNRELMAALEELASYARQPEAAQPGRLDEMRQDWSSRMEELGQISGDPRFGGLSGQLGQASPGEGPDQLAEARMVLQEGAGLLHEFLFNESSLSGMQINRQTAPPPDAYRRMVEDYFRRLANEPSSAP